MKLFAIIAYIVGTLPFLGRMWLETNLKETLLASLRELPHASAVMVRYLDLNDTWLSVAIGAMFNGAFWILCLGVFSLLYFWKRIGGEMAAP